MGAEERGGVTKSGRRLLFGEPLLRPNVTGNLRAGRGGPGGLLRGQNVLSAGTASGERPESGVCDD